MVTIQPSQLLNNAKPLQFAAQTLPQLRPASGGADQVQFSGNGSGKRSGFATKLALAVATLPVLAGIFAPVAAANVQPVIVQGEQVSVDEQAIPYVDNASDLPMLNNKLKDPVVDLARNPLLSAKTQRELEDFLNRFNQGGNGEMGVVVIPDTHQKQLGRLAMDLGNQIGVGDDALDNGLLLLINANAVRENRASGRMFIATGVGVDERMTDQVVTDLLVDNALPHLKAGNYDKAVEQTLKAATEMLENPEQTLKTNHQQGWWDGLSAGDQLVVILLAICVLGLLLAVLALDGGGGGFGGGGGGFGGGGDFGGGGGGFSGGSFGGSGGGI